ncbi:MAG: hypothetical protein JNL92_19135 [Opitutaceae bacterium]|nr:hypothetical protein [Opitutaceae bacterium]
MRFSIRPKTGFVLVGVISFFVLIYFVVILFFGNLVRQGVNRIGPTVLQAPVNLEEATMAPFSGLGTLTDLRIGNPAGWSDADALRISRIQIQVKPFSLFDDPVEINELEIEEIAIHYETKIIASNISDLLKNAEKSLGLNGPETKTPDGKPIRLIVRKFVLRGGTVTLSAGGQNLVISMPEILLVDLGVKEGGLTPPQLGFAILRSITANVVSAATKALGPLSGATGAAAAEGARQIGDAIKGFLEGAKKKE